MNNYDFCAEWAAAQRPERVLDYGCGAGQIVMRLRHRGIDAYGCDVFYEGGNYSEYVDPSYMGTWIRRMEGSRIPFADESFDLVINNQVLEHVEDLDAVLDEIERVLKPGGKVLSLFPDRAVWREGHCGVPFLHRFPRHSRFRVYYAYALRSLGFGYHKQNKTRWQWSEDFCEWLDRWTWYRDLAVIHAAFRRRFTPVTHIEEQWAHARLGNRARWLAPLPRRFQQWLVRKMVGLVFVSEKRDVRPQKSRPTVAQPDESALLS